MQSAATPAAPAPKPPRWRQGAYLLLALSLACLVLTLLQRTLPRILVGATMSWLFSLCAYLCWREARRHQQLTDAGVWRPQRDPVMQLCSYLMFWRRWRASPAATPTTPLWNAAGQDDPWRRRQEK